MKDTDYPWLRKYYEATGSGPSWIAQQVELARDTVAPDNAIHWNSTEQRWHTTDDITSRKFRATLGLPELPWTTGEATAWEYASTYPFRDHEESIALAHQAGQDHTRDSLPWWFRSIGRKLQEGTVISAVPTPYPAEDTTAFIVADRGSDFPERFVSATITPNLLTAGEWWQGCYHSSQEAAAVCAHRRALGMSRHESDVVACPMCSTEHANLLTLTQHVLVVHRVTGPAARGDDSVLADSWAEYVEGLRVRAPKNDSTAEETNNS